MSKSFKGKNLYNRMKSSLIIFFIIIICLLCKLFYLSVYKYEDYTNKIEGQSTQRIDLNSKRGVIYDRNNIALTDTTKKNILIIPKYIIASDYKNISIIKEATDLKENDIFKSFEEQKNNELIEIEVDKIKQKNKLEEIGILIEEKTERYKNNNLLSHTIGYINKNENKGVSGIEKSMDFELKESNKNYISVFKPSNLGKKNGLDFIEGSLSKVSDSNTDKNLKITIDSNMQQKIENIVDKEENPTVVIVSDVKSGEILAMSSRPNFNQNNISESLDKTDGRLQNRAISATYPAGSVFKIVVLFSALENKIINNKTYYYNCIGSEKVGQNEKLNCNNLSGHGIETLGEAFSNSCNTAFYDIAKKLGKDEIYSAIKKLHLDEKVDIGLDEEVNSNIPQEISLSNLSIGQGALEFTPIQINQLTQIIANNGFYKPLYIYDSIVDNSMNEVKKILSSKEEEIISPYTITQIKEFMIGVSENGTAKDLKDLEGGCGVKTGTAQSSINKNKISHGWITGFYPKNEPKYAITVLVEGTDKKSKSAIPIFSDICNAIK